MVPTKQFRGAGAIATAILLVACGSATSSGKSAEPNRTPLDAANFVDPTTSANQWHPLRPGMQWVREGTTEVGSRAVPHRVVTTMTDIVRIIDGVQTVAMLDQDTDSGQITQLSIDYMALDKDGNVWKLGGYTEEYEGGVFTNSVFASLGTRSGADPGILMPATPQPSTPRWFAGQHGSDEGSAAEVVEVGAHQCVPFACYDNVLIVREGKISAIDNEFKYYAPGVGQIMNSPKKDSKHKDTEQLVNVTRLSAVGLTEMSAEVMRLEAHARETQPDVFAGAPESRRKS